MAAKPANNSRNLNGSEFRKQLRRLILATWNIPPIFGLTFILFIQVLSLEQMVGILTTPLEPSFIIIWIIFSVWYFNRFTRPVVLYLDNPDEKLLPAAASCIRTFPLHYWGLFLLYLLLAPASVIVAAELYTDFVAQPIDWFRIHLVALIVSIIVGLPIFFRILDLFGRVMSSIPMSRPHVTIKTKVFLIGALIPLLIDTMLVQYFWTRTGYFNTETFVVWLVLELLAVGGSLIFVKSFSQSLTPLESLSAGDSDATLVDIDRLVSESTDEIGVLTKNYRKLLSDIKIQREMLELNNMLLSKTGYDISLNEIADTIVGLSQSALGSDSVFLILYDETTNELVGVAQSGSRFKEEGHYRIGLDETSMAVMVFKAGETFAISNVQSDPRCNREMKRRFNVKSALATPLIAEGRPIGVLMAVSNSKVRDYTPREITVIEGFAREAALAIHTNSLHRSKTEAEIQKKEQQELVELLMDSTEEAIYGTDTNGMCTFVNPACIRMLGYHNEHELIGKDMHELIHHTLPDGSPYPKEQCKVKQTITHGSSAHSADEVHWRKDGSSFPVEYWSHPIIKDGETIGAVVSFIDITARVSSEETILHMAYHDSLTGLVNRHEFENRIALAIDTVKNSNAQHALLYIDLDQFKVVNDTSGHEAGDQLLIRLAALLQEPVRQADTVARLGGDEFGVLLQGCDSERASEIANGIVHIIRELRFVWQDKTFSVGASIGIAMIDNPKLTTGEVLRTADMACYMSKELGRNRVHLFTPGDADLVRRETEMSLVSQIHDALDNDRFVLFHQPIVHLKNSNKKEIFEIFVRMLGDDGEIAPADVFVASAERFNLMPEIDRWVIRTAFSYVAANEGKDDIERLLFINLSGTSLNDQSFLAFVENELDSKVKNPGCICFEVTETAAIANIKQAQNFIHAIKSLGCHFALDDFGSGLSSFAYLKDLEVDYLKIDGSFVRDVASDSKDRSIVEAISQVGRSMGIRTIAEFVEDEKTIAILKELGVDYGQGYGIERPSELVAGTENLSAKNPPLAG